MLPATAQTAPPAPVVQVTAFRVTGNTLLPQATIDAELEPFKGARTPAQLNEAAVAVHQLYARAGYGGVVAFVPEQAITGGVVAITVVEGRLARVTVRSNRAFSDDNVRASVPGLRVGATPRLKDIDTQLRIANENPAKQTDVLLQPGARSGEIDASLNVHERPVQRFSVGLDNTGNAQTGRLRASVGWQHGNVWGRDHVLAVQLLTSNKPSKVKVASAGYRVPLPAQRATIDAYAAYSDIDGGSTATLAGDLRFNGRGRLAGVRMSRYLHRVGEVDQRIGVGLDYRAYLNDCGITGLPPGACGAAGESVAVQPLSLDYAAQWTGAWAGAVNASLHRNLQLSGSRSSDARFAAVRPGAKPRYTLLRMSARTAHQVAPDWQLQLRAAGQLTGDALVSGEQFGIGGIDSVRAYEEREVAGDRGVFASAEVVAPPIAGGVRLLAFADAGHVNNRLGTPCLAGVASCTLASAGVGARWSKDDFNARAYVASALKAGARTERHDARVHVAMSYSF